MQFIANIILFIGFIIGLFLIMPGLIILMSGGSGAMKPILSGLGVVIIGFIISSYIESIKFKK